MKINTTKIVPDPDKPGEFKTERGTEEIGPGHPAYALLQATEGVAEKNPGELAVGWEATQGEEQTAFGAATLGELGGPTEPPVPA